MPIAKESPQTVLWTDKSQPSHAGLSFGASKMPGTRHLRIGFTRPIPIGAILVRGGGQVSVLKPDAAGDPLDDSQWIAAERIVAGHLGRDEVGRDGYVLWTLPAVAQSKAIRFTHTAQVIDREYAGWLGGACVLPTRVANLAPQAIPTASSSPKTAKLLVNESTDGGWDQWCNEPQSGESRRATPVSEASPEWVLLTWTTPVKLSGIATLFAGFGEAEAQIYTGPADVHPREAPESAWQTVAEFHGLKNRYPSTLPVDWLDFGKTVTTRALRLRMTKSITSGGHPHTIGHDHQGRRVWLGELLALAPLGDADTKIALLPKSTIAEKPPIAVPFTLPEAGWVTLVIEDAAGKRVRNLIADTWFDKGSHVVPWDGSDDLTRDPSAPSHGLYYIPTHFVAPGGYRVRGLYRKQIDVKYEQGVYTAGSTPWETADKAGGWLSNHAAPQAVLYVPNVPGHGESILIGSYVSEGTPGLAWVDLDGKRWKGQGWVGGNWTGAPYLARDKGENAVPGIYAYVASAWETGKRVKGKLPGGEIRITGLTAKEDRPIARIPFTPKSEDGEHVRWEDEIGGLAVHDGLIAVSLPNQNRLVRVDAATGKVVDDIDWIRNPQGLAYEADGSLLALLEGGLFRFSPPGTLQRTTRIREFEEPAGLTVDDNGNIYVSDQGKRHTVTVIEKRERTPADYEKAKGELPALRIGRPGPPKAGRYDPLHMNHPHGLTVDSRGRLWVAENDFQPKRVSVWNPDGSLDKAFYGPAEYGGGGVVDPLDRTRFFYHGMEFKLDPEKGTDKLVSVFWRSPGELPLSFRAGGPATPIYHDGKRYFTNCWSSNPTGGTGVAFLWQERDGIAQPIAAMGRAGEWDLLKTPEFATIWPKGTDPKISIHDDRTAFFVWSDTNGDGKPQPDEIQMVRGRSGGVTNSGDLSFLVTRLGDKSMRFAPVRFTPLGVPVYDLDKRETLALGTQGPPSSGGDQVLLAPDGWNIQTTAPKPFPASAIAGVKNGVPMWSYPSLWPGLHASHEAPVPEQPGVVVGHTRLVGDVITPTPGEPMFLLNGNHGPVYVFTVDGLFVGQLFQEMRVGRRWEMPLAQKGMLLNDISPSDENFWPFVTQTPDGIYLSAGRTNCIVKIEGLETVRRLEARDLTVTADDLDRARESLARAEAARQASQGRGVLVVPIREKAPTIDGKLDDWADAEWVDVDKRGTRAYFNSDRKPYDVTAAARVAGDRLFVAWRTGDKDLLKNSGEAPTALFKTGGALDLMIAVDPKADPKRTNAAVGDQRLLVTQVAGKTRALLYQAVVPGTKEPVPFSSPWRTITLDRVTDVSGKIELAAADGNYELAVPLSLLGLEPRPGLELRGDVGILRGQGGVTTQRVYWSNKATAIVADVPSEAELRPGLWGRWRFE